MCDTERDPLGCSAKSFSAHSNQGFDHLAVREQFVRKFAVLSLPLEVMIDLVDLRALHVLTFPPKRQI